MAGLLNSSPAGQAAPQGNAAPASSAPDQQIDDPLLQQIEQGIEQQVPPEMKQMYESIVLAGMKVMFSKDTASLMDQQLDASGDMVANIADGISMLIMIVFNEAQQPPEQFIPAAGLASITLMCHALDYAEQTRGLKVDEQFVADCTKATTMKVLERFGITQDQVGQVIAAGQQQGGAQPPQGV